MPNSTQFSEYENEQTITYRKRGISGHGIPTKINRSKIVICKFLKNPKVYEKKKCTDSSHTLTMLQKCAIPVDPA